MKTLCGLWIAAGCTWAQVGGCSVFPADNVWNTRIDGLPVDAKSAAYVETIGAAKPLHPDFGQGSNGIPFTLVNGTQARVAVRFDYADESDAGPYPIPSDAPIEAGSDAHVLVIDTDHCVLYELWSSAPRTDGSWRAGSGAIFDLTCGCLRPSGWTSADAAGLPVFPGLVRYDEVAAGEILHALRFTAPQTRKEFVWPARHAASSLTGAQYPPMGQRFRLRADFDVSNYATPVQVILTALKRYGMILADNGSSWFVSGAPDDRWDDDQLGQMKRLRGADFEAVDESTLMLMRDSGRSQGNSPTPAPLPLQGNARK